MQQQMIISVMAKDRPGIIAEVTKAIFELDGDLADLNQSILRGYLTMILIASFAATVRPGDVSERIRASATGEAFEIIVKPMNVPLAEAATGLPEKTYIVTAQGKNRSGLVYGISSFCCERSINILDLSTTLADGQYTMVLQLDLSTIESIRDLRRELAEYAEKAGLKVMMQHYDIFKVTHEVTLI